jgi:deazaflavin-dependent oxidoreductase (nitroreductase family)
MTRRRAGRANDPTAALHHVGRKSGRPYVTPLAAEPVAGGFIIPLVYGDDTDWCRNLLAAGQGTLELRGEAISILNPRIVELATVQDPGPGSSGQKLDETGDSAPPASRSRTHRAPRRLGAERRLPTAESRACPRR